MVLEQGLPSWLCWMILSSSTKEKLKLILLVD